MSEVVKRSRGPGARQQTKGIRRGLQRAANALEFPTSSKALTRGEPMKSRAGWSELYVVVPDTAATMPSMKVVKSVPGTR